MLVSTNKGYKASKYERVLEKEILAYLKSNNLKLINLCKFCHEDDDYLDIKYDLYIDGCDEAKCDKLCEDLGFALFDVRGSEYTLVGGFTVPFDEEEKESFIKKANDKIGEVEKSLGIMVDGISVESYIKSYVENKDIELWGLLESISE